MFGFLARLKPRISGLKSSFVADYRDGIFALLQFMAVPYRK
jgi:hypothetical protein